MAGSGWMATRGTSVRPRLRRLALVASVCALFGVVNTAQAPPPVELVRPTAVAPHAYFDALAARPERVRAWSLRNQEQLNDLVTKPPSEIFKYLGPGNDDYARPQDAAKIVKPPRDQFPTAFPGGRSWFDGTIGGEGFPNQQRLRFPLGITSGTALLTWDVYWGEEFKTNAGPKSAWKTFFLFTGEEVGGTEFHWLGHNVVSMARGSAGEVSKFHDGPTGRRRSWTTAAKTAANVISGDPRVPTGQGAVPSRTFTTYYNRWTRYWLEVRMDVPGSEFTEWSQQHLGGAPLAAYPAADTTWDMMSLWIADEQRDPVRVLYRVPAPRLRTEMLASFRLSWDTSSTNVNGEGLLGPVIGYVRNMAVLRNATVDDRISVPTSGTRPRAPTNVRIVP